MLNGQSDQSAHPAADTAIVNQQSFILRSHFMNCSMPWVSLDSSRNGRTALQESVVSGRGERKSHQVNQGEFNSSSPPSFQFDFILPRFLLTLPSLCLLRENCSTRQVTRRDKWGQLLLTTPKASHSLATHLGILGVSLGVPLEEEVRMIVPQGDGTKRG